MIMMIDDDDVDDDDDDDVTTWCSHVCWLVTWEQESLKVADLRLRAHFGRPTARFVDDPSQTWPASIVSWRKKDEVDHFSRFRSTVFTG